MFLELVSYVHGLSFKDKISITSQVINDSNADLILFPGHTIDHVSDLEKLSKSINNKRVDAIIEVECLKSDRFDNSLFRISNGKIINLHTHQLFARSSEIEGNYFLTQSLIHELKTRRLLSLLGKTFVILQCGELNILKNIQSNNNDAHFRLKHDQKLLKEFTKLISQVDVFLNPLHTPMGNQMKMGKRREYLSKGSRFYFSTSNTPEESCNLELKSLQYSLYDGTHLENIASKSYGNAVSRLYKLF